MKIKPATEHQRALLDQAINCLKAARNASNAADCPNVTKRICAALKSADGARRHMVHRVAVTEGVRTP